MCIYIYIYIYIYIFKSCALPPTLSHGRRMKCFCRPCNMEVCLCEGRCFPNHYCCVQNADLGTKSSICGIDVGSVV